MPPYEQKESRKWFYIMLDLLADIMENEKPAFAAWVTTPSPIIAETLAVQGWDAIIIDMQHAAISSVQMTELVKSVVAHNVPAIVRVRQDDVGLASLALDQGALGVIFPMVETGAQGRVLASYTKYPPEGSRSWGPQRSLMLSGLDKETYLARANQCTQTFAMIETETALQHLDAILSVQGFDGVLLGPNDLAVSLTKGRSAQPDEDVVLQAAEHLAKKADAHHVKKAVFANTIELAQSYADMGFDLIAVGSDLGHLKKASGEALLALRS